MTWWQKEALAFLREVRQNESENNYEPSEEEWKRAIIYTRQDIILLIGYLVTANKQLSSIKSLLVFILVVLIAIWVKL